MAKDQGKTEQAAAAAPSAVAKETFTLETVQALITKATQGLATVAEVQEMINSAQNALIDYVNMVGGAAPIELSATNAAPVQAPVDPAWLKGLLFTDATQERKVIDGRPRLVASLIERDLEPADVLAYRIADDQVFLVTADGKKHTVEI